MRSRRVGTAGTGGAPSRPDRIGAAGRARRRGRTRRARGPFRRRNRWSGRPVADGAPRAACRLGRKHLRLGRPGGGGSLALRLTVGGPAGRAGIALVKSALGSSGRGPSGQARERPRLRTALTGGQARRQPSADAGALARQSPSVRGAPGASGWAAGSNASLRFCGLRSGGGRGAARPAGVAPEGRAAPQLLEAVLDVLLELLELLLEPLVLELQAARSGRRAGGPGSRAGWSGPGSSAASCARRGGDGDQARGPRRPTAKRRIMADGSSADARI